MQLAEGNLESYLGIFLNLLFTDASFVRDENVEAIRQPRKIPCPDLHARSPREAGEGRGEGKGGAAPAKPEIAIYH